MRHPNNPNPKKPKIPTKINNNNREAAAPCDPDTTKIASSKYNKVELFADLPKCEVRHKISNT